MGVIHLGPLSALPGTCIVLRALAMLYDPGGTCTVLAYRPAHYCLRPKVELSASTCRSIEAESLHAFALRLSHSFVYASCWPHGFTCKTKYRLLARLCRVWAFTRLYYTRRTGAHLLNPRAEGASPLKKPPAIEQRALLSKVPMGYRPWRRGL